MKSDELQDAKRSHGTISFDEDGAERPGKAQSVQEKANKNSAGPGAMSLPTRSQRLRKNDSSSPIPQQAGGKQGDSSNVFVQQQPSRLAQGDGSKIFIPESARRMKVDNTPLARLQRVVRNKCNPRLHAAHLSDRLMFESAIVRGTFRLVNQTLIFALMLIALKISGDPAVKRGIYNDLQTSFDFDSLVESDSRSAWIDALPAIAEASKNYFILSSQYFEETGNVELLGPLQTFSSPKLLGGVDLAISVPQISFTAWLKVTPQFNSGYLLRKRLVPAGDGSDLACWGWYLDKKLGPQLHFAVHDFFPTDRDVSSTKSHLELDLSGTHSADFPADEFSLVSMLVNSTHVSFHRNLEMLGAVEMKRPLTDCFNNFEGILVGGAGMEIGQLRFYPRQLSKSDIEEIYQFGSRLSDMSTGSQPFKANEDPVIGLRKSVLTAVGQVKSEVKDRQNLLELASAAQMAQELRANSKHRSPGFDPGDTPASQTPETDIGINRTFFQIVRNASRLTDWRALPSAQERMITDMPSFKGTGMTLTWWYRHVACSAATCGLYLFHSGDFSGAQNAKEWCWTLWIENKAIWYDAGGGGYAYFEQDMGIPSKFHPSGDKFWRHMAMQMDERDDIIRFYLDGVLAHERQWDVKSYGRINEADCDTTGDGKKRLALGHNYGGWNNAAEVEIADIRMYVHESKTGSLTKEDVQKVAKQPIPSSTSQTDIFVGEDYKCLPVTSPKLADTTWIDSHGNDCEWYFNQKQIRPDICLLEEPSRQCPKSCQSRQECLLHTDSTRKAAAAAAAASAGNHSFKDVPCVKATIAFEDRNDTANIIGPLDNKTSSTTVVLTAAMNNLGNGAGKYIKSASGEYMKVKNIGADGVTLTVERASSPPGLHGSAVALAAPNGSAVTLADASIEETNHGTKIKLIEAIHQLDVGEYIKKSDSGEYMEVTSKDDSGKTITVRHAATPLGLTAGMDATATAGTVTMAEKFNPPIDTGAHATYFTWDRTDLVRMQSENGTVCLGKGTSKSQVVQQCRAWIDRNVNGGEGALGGRGLDANGLHTGIINHPDDDYIASWLESIGVEGQGFKFKPAGVPQFRAGRRLNLTVCEELESSIDDFCGFDLEPVRKFTKDLKANGGDFTIAFWVRADPRNPDQSKMGESGRFFPHVSLYASISPPEPALTVGRWVNPNGEVRLHSKCVRKGAKDLYWNVEHRKVSNTDWTFIAMTTSNSTDPMEMHTITNLGVKSEESPLCTGYTNCLFDDEYLFKGIEINYPMLISPIMMVPRKLPFATLQEEYLSRARDMRIKIGPLSSNADRQKIRISMEKNDYTSRSILMASPIIFQTRARASTTCPFNYSTEWISNQHEKAVYQKCNAPFECDDFIRENKQSLIACKGGAAGDAGELYFGLTPQDFKGTTGYADFLFAIADNDFVFRQSGEGGGYLRATDTFIDSLTDAVKVVLVFFTPSKGIVTILELAADFTGMDTIKGTVSVDHYGILEGPGLTLYFIMQSVVLVNLAIMLFDVFSGIRSAVNEYWSLGEFPWGKLTEPFIDLSCASLVLVYIVMKIPRKLNSASETANILGALDQIPWSSSDVPLDSKKMEFFDNVMALIGLIEEEKMMNTLCNAILLVNLLRVIQCTSVHPRLALLTGTLSNAADDLWHTAILTCMLMLCFAGIGQWRFGNTREDFGDYETALRTEFQMLFGEFPEGWGDDPALQRELQVFVVLYFLVLFLLVLNFLLAIIVEAYMKLRGAIDEKKTEQAFLTDVRQSVWSRALGLIYGWPSPRFLGSDLTALSGKNSVGFQELYATGLFRNPSSIRSFLQYYNGYNFMQPRAVTRYGIHPHESHVWSDVLGSPDTTIKQDLAMLGAILDRKIRQSAGDYVPTLKEELKNGIETVVHRRRNAGKEDIAEEMNALLCLAAPAAAPAAVLREIQRREKQTAKTVDVRNKNGKQAGKIKRKGGVTKEKDNDLKLEKAVYWMKKVVESYDESHQNGSNYWLSMPEMPGLPQMPFRADLSEKSGVNDISHWTGHLALDSAMGLVTRASEPEASTAESVTLQPADPLSLDQRVVTKEQDRSENSSWGGMGRMMLERGADLEQMLPTLPALEFEIPTMELPFYAEFVEGKTTQTTLGGVDNAV